MMTDREILSKLRKGVTEYKMINDGDKIAVGVSGGKDSLALVKALALYKRFSPETFDLSAITVDLQFDGKPSDFSPIRDFCEELNVPYYVVPTQIGEIVFDARKESNPCALCSKMRKGALYQKATEIGCNKIALGHHADDFTDTFIMSMFYEGRLSTFAPKSYLDRTGLTLIRPLILVKETQLKSYSKTLPVAKSKCPADKHTSRELIKNIIDDINKKIPGVKEMIFTALTHPERYNLFDKFEAEKDEF